MSIYPYYLSFVLTTKPDLIMTYSPYTVETININDEFFCCGAGLINGQKGTFIHDIRKELYYWWFE
jgi:hypothetical protein